jgi:hypothetical protein
MRRASTLGGACRIDVMRKGLPHWPPKVGQPKKSPCICDSKGNVAFGCLVVSKHNMFDWKDYWCAGSCSLVDSLDSSRGAHDLRLD